METLKAILIDDEWSARGNLRALLAAHPEIEVVAEAEDVGQAKELIAAKRPDVAFLDIQMPGGGGFELLAQLPDPPAIVFVTAYDEYAVRAFEVNAVDYLLKPVEPRRLAMAVARLLRPEGGGDGPVGPYAADDRVLIKTGRRCLFVPAAQIAAVRAAENYSYVVCENAEEHLVRRTLKEWEALLPGDCFVVLDRSCLVNWRQVGKWAVSVGGVELYVGRCAEPLRLGRAAAHRFKTEVVPRIEQARAERERSR
jgi:two-component system LytT family response regulator